MEKNQPVNLKILRTDALATCDRAVRAKQCTGLMSGTIAKLVSPTRPREVDEMPMWEIEDGDMIGMYLETVGSK